MTAKSWWLVVNAGLFLLGFSLQGGLAKAAETLPSKGKVAVVNGKVITQADFDQQLAIAGEQMAKTGNVPTNADILESLIDFELLYQGSEKKGITVDDKTVSAKFDQWKKQFSSDAEYQEVLAKLKLSESGIKDKFKRGMQVQAFIDKQFAQNVVISDQESKAFYDSHLDYFKIPEQVHARHILIKVDPNADAAKKAEARKKIGEIQQRLKKGEDFAALAKEFSQCPSSANGGDLGSFGRTDMVEPFAKTAFSLKPGEVSGIVETSFGFHLIKMVDKKPPTTVAYETIKARLVAMLKQEKMQKEIDQYLEGLKKSTKIERYLKTN